MRGIGASGSRNGGDDGENDGDDGNVGRQPGGRAAVKSAHKYHWQRDIDSVDDVVRRGRTESLEKAAEEEKQKSSAGGLLPSKLGKGNSGAEQAPEKSRGTDSRRRRPSMVSWISGKSGKQEGSAEASSERSSGGSTQSRGFVGLLPSALESSEDNEQETDQQPGDFASTWGRPDRSSSNSSGSSSSTRKRSSTSTSTSTNTNTNTNSSNGSSGHSKSLNAFVGFLPSALPQRSDDSDDDYQDAHDNTSEDDGDSELDESELAARGSMYWNNNNNNNNNNQHGSETSDDGEEMIAMPALRFRRQSPSKRASIRLSFLRGGRLSTGSDSRERKASTGSERSRTSQPKQAVSKAPAASTAPKSSGKTMQNAPKSQARSRSLSSRAASSDSTSSTVPKVKTRPDNAWIKDTASKDDSSTSSRSCSGSRKTPSGSVSSTSSRSSWRSKRLSGGSKSSSNSLKSANSKKGADTSSAKSSKRLSGGSKSSSESLKSANSKKGADTSSVKSSKRLSGGSQSSSGSSKGANNNKRKSSRLLNLRNVFKPMLAKASQQTTEEKALGGVTVGWLTKVRDDIMEERIAPNVELGILVPDVEGRSSIRSFGSILPLPNETEEEEEAEEAFVNEVSDGRSFRVKSDSFNSQADHSIVVYKPESNNEVRMNVDNIAFKDRRDWTVQDVAERCKTAIEKGYRKRRSGNEDVTLVIHSQKSNFFELIEALESTFGSDTLVWLDFACPGDKPETPNQSAAFVKRFNRRVVFLDSWLDPLPLERAWAVLEMHASIKADNGITTLLGPDWKSDLLLAVQRDHFALAQACTNFDVRKSKSGSPEIHTEVLEAARACGNGGPLGLARVSTTVGEALTEALARDLDAALEDFDENRFKASSLLHRSAHLMDAIGNSERALALFEQSLDLERSKGNSTKRVARTLQDIALCCQKLMMLDQAIEYSSEALDIYRRHYGNNHIRVAEALATKATILVQQLKFTEAIMLFEESLRISEALEGSCTLSCAKVQHNLAVLHQGLGEDSAAFHLLEKALMTRKEFSKPGVSNSKVGATHLAIGEIYRKNEDFDKALPAYLRSLDAHFPEEPFDFSLLFDDEEDFRTLLHIYDGPEDGPCISPQALRTLFAIGNAYRDKGESERALVTHSFTLAAAKNSLLGDGDALVVDLKRQISGLLQGAGIDNGDSLHLAKEDPRSRARSRSRSNASKILNPYEN